MIITTRPVGELLRQWRQRRHMSQLDLACEADISARHLSFVETGRAQPSREMLMHLSARLDIPLRERNRLLIAAGYAPLYAERPLADPALVPAREAIERLLAGHEPYPAIAIDRHWTLVAANRSIAPFLVGAAPELLKPPVNVLRLSLHPQGLAPRILNLAQWRSHLLMRLRHQIDVSGDPVLIDLMADLRALPVPAAMAQGTSQGASSSTPQGASPGMPPPSTQQGASPGMSPSTPLMADTSAGGQSDVLAPLRIQTERAVLSLLSTTTVFGTPIDVTLSELAIESFFPADAQTAALLRDMTPAPA